MSVRVQCLCVDTADPDRIARFWAKALDWHGTDDEPDQVVLELLPPGSQA
jgi:hypothetical protein